MLPYIILCVIGIIIIFIYPSRKTSNQDYFERKGSLSEVLEDALVENNIVASLKYTFDGTTAYILDKESEQFVYLYYKYSNHSFSPTYFPLKNIIDVSLIIDGETITTSVRGSQFGGALVGGLLAGSAGAVIGGLSGKTTTKEAVSQLYLIITFNNSEDAVQKIAFIDSKDAILKSAETFKTAFSQATEWENQLKLTIYEFKKSENYNIKEENKVVPDLYNSSLADEIKKLHSLVSEGILTEEEFVLQKEKLLSK